MSAHDLTLALRPGDALRQDDADPGKGVSTGAEARQGEAMALTVPKDARAGKSAHEVIESKDFKALVAKRWSVSVALLVALFVTYYGFILLIATNRELMATRIGAYTTLAIPVGIAVIVVSFLLTAVYIGWANKSYDPEVERLKKQLRQ